MPSKSKQQQKFMGMVHSLQKGDMKPSDASPEVKKAAQSMSDKDAKDYASTSHKGLPKKVKQEIVKKLKEYANKMGRDHLGGDDYTSKKKGGLRDFDGYDNVDYNKDMPMDESGIPQNFHQGRTSDYHTALRGKNKDYSGGTNFKKSNAGQPDIEDDNEDQETNQLSNKQTHIKSDKLKVSEGFDKVEHLKLLNLALRTMPNSPKQKEIIKKLNKVRVAGGMKPLKETSIVEYGQRLDLSFIEDEEAKLDGTPQPKDAIDTELEEVAKRDYKAEYKKFQSSTKAKKYRAELNKYNRQKGTYGNGDGKDASHKGGKIVGFESESKNRGRAEKSRLKKESTEDKQSLDEIGVFPVQAFIKDMIPGKLLNTTTPENKEKLQSVLRDLKGTLNQFWKSHNIPYRIK